MQHLIFLDFDGVLHGWNTPIFSCMKRFENILRDNQHVKVVFSTAWRYSHSHDRLKEYFSKDVHHQLIASNPMLQPEWPPYLRHGRYVECTRYIDDNDYEGAWTAIDDAADLFPPDCANLFLVNGSVGIDKETEMRLRNRLNSTFA